jgi:hypothetical protein
MCSETPVPKFLGELLNLANPCGSLLFEQTNRG